MCVCVCARKIYKLKKCGCLGPIWAVMKGGGGGEEEEDIE